MHICFHTGTYDKDGTESSGTIGWSVTFGRNDKHSDSNSTTTWSGQRQLVGGFPIIRTTWLLTRETIPSKNWESTFINQDFYHRSLPKDEIIRATLLDRNFKEYTY